MFREQFQLLGNLRYNKYILTNITPTAITENIFFRYFIQMFKFRVISFSHFCVHMKFIFFSLNSNKINLKPLLKNLWLNL